ncbi:MAG: AAA family ATPase [Synergistaceae bacterium]|nr:AAA family ATPase [Synergistaceae bacterium]
MLERLFIRNVGGISRCELLFEEGFTVVTGESGAGKSSIVRAIEIVAGKRAQTSLIRAGEEEAVVEAVFQMDVRLSGLEDEQQPAEGVFFAKRILSRGGRGRAAVQGVPAPLTLYSSALERLVHIQSQFAQMELLDAGRQLAMVDSCGGPPLLEALSELREAFERARIKFREKREIGERRAEIERRYANAAEVVPLVRKVNPEAGLEAGLEEEIAALYRQSADGTKISQGLDQLTGGLAGRGLLDELEGVCKTLTDCLPAQDAANAGRLALEGLQNLRDLTEIARRHAGSSEGLSEEIERLEQRLGALRKLRRLVGVGNEEDLLTYCQEAQENLTWLEGSYEHLEKAAREAGDLTRTASGAAQELRKARRLAASALEERVNSLLNSLAMEGITFEVRFTELPKLRRNGADGAEFVLVSNKGSVNERSGRVDKIASGGELSRLLLALQLSLPDEWLPPTLVFDEVEAGLGGKAAVLSGLKLLELSRRCQVLLITHEASIAALGSRHYVVRKDGGESFTQRVDGEERVWELARMLSGDAALPEAQEHARRLLGY